MLKAITKWDFFAWGLQTSRNHQLEKSRVEFIKMKMANGHFIDKRMRRDICGCLRVKDDQISLLAQIGQQAFGEAGPLAYGISRREYYQRLYSINPHIFRFILADPSCPVTESNLGGFLSVIPTHKNTYEKFSRGQKSQFEFSNDEIAPPDYLGPFDLYIQALYLDPKLFPLMRRLLQGLMCALSELSYGRIDGNGPFGNVRIYGEGVTKIGRKIMGAFDMQIKGRSSEGNPIYVIDTALGKPLTIKTPYKLLNTELQQILCNGPMII